MKVYVMMDAFDTPVTDKIVGVYQSLKDAVKDANNIISYDGVLVEMPIKGNAYRVINSMGNVWFYIVERDVLKGEKG